MNKEPAGPIPGLPQVPKGALTKIDGFLDEDRMARMVRTHRASRQRRSPIREENEISKSFARTPRKALIIPHEVSSQKASNTQYGILDHVLSLIASDADHQNLA